MSLSLCFLCLYSEDFFFLPLSLLFWDGISLKLGRRIKGTFCWLRSGPNTRGLWKKRLLDILGGNINCMFKYYAFYAMPLSPALYHTIPAGTCNSLNKWFAECISLGRTLCSRKSHLRPFHPHWKHILNQLYELHGCIWWYEWKCHLEKVLMHFFFNSDAHNSMKMLQWVY